MIGLTLIYYTEGSSRKLQKKLVTESLVTTEKALEHYKRSSCWLSCRDILSERVHLDHTQLYRRKDYIIGSVTASRCRQKDQTCDMSDSA